MYDQVNNDKQTDGELHSLHLFLDILFTTT